ncbi:hypothetical protein RIF29_10733 [Crotalaria pallida]|uniref:SLC26A/SulP transporter domain-containing protein n=1 Tax=Crotalaria pallida TaxID=3830 RepID=A0AAN9G096_CROPI
MGGAAITIALQQLKGFLGIKKFTKKTDVISVMQSVFTKLSTGGGRLVICSDGVWDALSAEVALDSCRGMSAEAATPHIAKGLRDDTTCIVVDILPQEKPPPTNASQLKKPGKGMLKYMFRKKSSESSYN